MSDDAPTWVTVANCEDAIEAHLLVGRLNAEGIETFIAHEHQIWADWTMSNALGGVKVQVHAHDVPQASELVAMHRRGDFALDESEYNGVQCPACGSYDVERDDLSRKLGFLMIMFAGWFFPWRTRDWRYHCFDCDHRWSEPKSEDETKKVL